MKAEQGMGLVIAGSVNRSFLSRMPTLLAHLGPIKGSSPQASRQAVKSLNAGYAVFHYSALELCSLIWISTPEARLDRVVRDLAAQMPVRRTMIVVCECDRESRWPNALRDRGARIASLNAVQESRECLFVAEGHPDTVRIVKRLLAADERKVIPLFPASKPLYLAGVHLTSHLLLPWIDAAVESLRASGFSRSEATDAVQAWVRGILRQYQHTGPKVWNRNSLLSLRRFLEQFLDRVCAEKPQVASLYCEGARLAHQYFAPKTAVAGTGK
jgi:hypothetical protein